MLVKAMDSYQLAKKAHTENVKAQYTDKGNVKNYFRASGMGQGDRKLIYSFFQHQITTSGKTARNLRQLENGDYVHDRYQSAWEDMGVLLSMEERLSSKDDEFLKEYDWEWTGHYDGLLDVNIMRAHALGKVNVTSVFNEDTEKYEIEVELDEAYANSIGIFDENGDIAEDYEPITMVADIKTMNPWGFKRIKEKKDVSDIGGYLDQIQFYMYMLNTPYGSIYIEDKGGQDVVEIQVLWKDMHEDVEYTFDEDIHGKQDEEVVRVVIDTERFFGSDEVEGLVPRVQRLWERVEALREADEAGDLAKVAELMPDRCGEKPDSFPCSWKSGRCDFYDHCWGKSNGLTVRDYEEIPAEAIWSFEDEDGTEIKIDNRKVPEGVDYDGFIKLVEIGALDYTKFQADTEVQSDLEKEEEIQENALNADNLFNGSGELNLGAGVTSGDKPSEASEYETEEGEKAIDCINCGKQITYKRLGNGGTKKCPHCKHTNRVVKS